MTSVAGGRPPWLDGCRRRGGLRAVLAADADVPALAGELGRVAIDVPASPLMWFTGYHEAPEKTAERFSKDGRWYHTGDAAKSTTTGTSTFPAATTTGSSCPATASAPFDVESVPATPGRPRVGDHRRA